MRKSKIVESYEVRERRALEALAARVLSDPTSPEEHVAGATARLSRPETPPDLSQLAPDALRLIRHALGGERPCTCDTAKRFYRREEP